MMYHIWHIWIRNYKMIKQHHWYIQLFKPIPRLP
jgi:hypothetical protein